MELRELVGKTATRYLKERALSGSEDGVARFILDCLSPSHLAAIAHQIINDPEIRDNIELRLPRKELEQFDVPRELLTDKRATHFRNKDCKKRILVIANSGDDEQQSIKDMTPIGSDQLFAYPGYWVDAILSERQNLLSEQHKEWWVKALQGLTDAQSQRIERFARYILLTYEGISDDGEGLPILHALGWALPALRIPRDRSYFQRFDDTTVRHPSRWRKLFESLTKQRQCFLLKKTRTGSPLSSQDLQRTFNRVKGNIPDDCHPVVQTFIDSDLGWNQSSEDLAHVEWEEISPLFTEIRGEKFHLGKKTLEFYDENFPERLEESEKPYLRTLKSSSNDEEADWDFYDRHREELKTDPSLKAHWDKFIFGSPVEEEDFLVGLTRCLEAFFSSELIANRRILTIRCDKTTKGDLRNINIHAGSFFVRRYSSLPNLLGRDVKWEVGQLFNFETLLAEWREKAKGNKRSKEKLNQSTSRKALQLRFYLDLEVEAIDGSFQVFSRQLVWRFNLQALTCQFVDDYDRLNRDKGTLPCSEVTRETVSGKGHLQPLELENNNSLYPCFGQQRGSLVPALKPEYDIHRTWKDGLKHAEEQDYISSALSGELDELFESFKSKYEEAVQAFSQEGEGAITPALREQAEIYGNLLELICLKAKGDRNRDLLLKPILQIGTVLVKGSEPAVIIPPWHPLRLLAVYRKSEIVSGLCKKLLQKKELKFGDSQLFFSDLRSIVDHSFYPEIVVYWEDGDRHLLSMTDSYLDYSLHEIPVRSQEANHTNERPRNAARLVINILENYVQLYPHEISNLSTVLYNCDSAKLPQAVLSKISELKESEQGMRCEVILKHRDGQLLRDLYQDLVASSVSDLDSPISSELSTDFVARLRIGMMIESSDTPRHDGEPTADIVFLQDVISRNSHIEWMSESANPVKTEALVPSHWSRRRPAAKDDTKSVVYLCSPAQTKAGWQFITAVETSVRKKDWDGDGKKRLLPARVLDFGDNETSDILEEIHSLGAWVINYDELLDRNQLVNQGIKVIKYKQSVGHGRNILISSGAKTALLLKMVRTRLTALGLDFSDEEYDKLAQKFIDDANRISGDIVLRAAKRGRNASELLGLVLSQFILQDEIGPQDYLGWYFLDDYSAWLGQKEQQIADILALSPKETEDGRLQVNVYVSEAKYVSATSSAAEKRKSARQLRDTVGRMRDGLFSDPERFDRSIWLARFSDLLMNGIRFTSNDRPALSDWRRKMREGDCDFFVRGYSHVFISGPSDSTEDSALIDLDKVEGCYQEVFSRAHVRELVKLYSNSSSPLAFRKEVMDRDIWGDRKYKNAPPTMTSYAGLETRDEAGSTRHSENVDDERETPPAPQVNESQAKSMKDQKGKSASTHPQGERPDWLVPQIGKMVKNYQDSEEMGAATSEWLENASLKCKQALQHFQYQAKFVEKSLTPNAALLKFVGSADLTVEKVLKRRSEFLSTYGLRLISVTAEPGVVAIAIARDQRAILNLLGVWKDWKSPLDGFNDRILIAVREEDSMPLYLSPRDHSPHTLVAGATGSGKSVLMQNLILGIASTNHPSMARITVIDPKMGVDYFPFDGLPHLTETVIDDQDRAVHTLSQLIEEMDNRYRLLKENRATNIFEYNQKVSSDQRLPFVWLIHDEFAEWMMTETYRDHVSQVVSRLGVKARAAGISLVFAAQRPDNNVMPMQLRSNLGNRLILRVDSEGTSEIALNERGAERLLGKGHMAARLEGEPNLVFAQVPFVSADTITEMVRILIDEYNGE